MNMTSPAKLRANTRRLDRLNIKVTAVLRGHEERRGAAYGISVVRPRVVPDLRPSHRQ
jgi:hypothetical protein